MKNKVFENFDFNNVRHDTDHDDLLFNIEYQRIFNKICHNLQLTDDEDELFSKNIQNGYKFKYKVKDKTEIKKILNNARSYLSLKLFDVTNIFDLNWLDVSEVQDMSYLFQYLAINIDISQWDVSGVRHMDFMFNHSTRQVDLSKWNVSNVISMTEMFANSYFNGDISNWDVSSVLSM